MKICEKIDLIAIMAKSYKQAGIQQGGSVVRRGGGEHDSRVWPVCEDETGLNWCYPRMHCWAVTNFSAASFVLKKLLSGKGQFFASLMDGGVLEPYFRITEVNWTHSVLLCCYFFLSKNLKCCGLFTRQSAVPAEYSTLSSSSRTAMGVAATAVHSGSCRSTSVQA